MIKTVGEFLWGIITGCIALVALPFLVIMGLGVMAAAAFLVFSLLPYLILAALVVWVVNAISCKD